MVEHTPGPWFAGRGQFQDSIYMGRRHTGREWHCLGVNDYANRRHRTSGDGNDGQRPPNRRLLHWIWVELDYGGRG